jgi:transposase
MGLLPRQRTAEQTKAEIERELRREKAVALKLAGKQYREIAKELGVSLETAYNDVMVVLERTRKSANESAQESRQIAIERADRILEKLEPLLDNPRSAARAAEVILKAEERRAKLLGLDAPTRVQAEVAAVTLDELDALRSAAESNDACSPLPASSESEPEEPSS